MDSSSASMVFPKVAFSLLNRILSELSESTQQQGH
jgi:hypothetical protein